MSLVPIIPQVIDFECDVVVAFDVQVTYRSVSVTFSLHVNYAKQ